MTYADIALYAVVAFATGLVTGFSFGGIGAFIRALLN